MTRQMTPEEYGRYLRRQAQFLPVPSSRQRAPPDTPGKKPHAFPLLACGLVLLEIVIAVTLGRKAAKWIGELLE